MDSDTATMLLTTRLTGVTFEGRQEKLAALRKQGEGMPRKLRHVNDHGGYEGIAAFLGKEGLGWIPKDLSVGLLLPEIKASNIWVDRFELCDIVGGTAEKKNYGAEVMMILKGDRRILDILADEINELQRKATIANVAGGSLTNIAELKETHAEKIKQTIIDDENKLFIIGASQMQPNDVRKLLHEYSITDGQYEIENDYYALKNSDGISNQFKYLFFGPTPHSGKGMGNENSVIEHYQKLPEFIVKLIRNETGHLKLTTSGLRSALDELVVS